MDFLAVTAGVALPWFLGIVLVDALGVTRRDGDAPWRLGCGWFIGTFALTLWLRVLSIAGIPFGVLSAAAPLVLVSAVLLAVLARRRQLSVTAWPSSVGSLAGRDLGSLERMLWIALLAWLSLRFALLLHEVVVRPLYPWDAWTQWSTKARVWFAERAIVPFVPSAEWLTARAPDAFFDAAPHYPATVPLMQTWMALMLGRWDDALVNAPWWANGVAFAFALYGALRAQRFEPVAALVGTWLVVSLPILEVHVALAGYADLAMASYFTLAALAALRFVDSRRWPDAVLAAILAVACVTIKNPGKAWVLTLVPALVVAWNVRFVRGVLIAFGLVALAVVIIAQTGFSILGYQLQGQFRLPWSALADAYLMFGNWNLLGYAVLALAVLAWKHLLEPAVAPYSVLVLGGLMFLFFGFAFTNAGVWVEDQSTVNRATLHLAPLIAVWLLVTFRAWSASRAPQVAPASPA